MFAQNDALFTGQLVFALTAILGLGSLGIKLLGRKSPEQLAVNRDEFRDFRQETIRQLELVRERADASLERVLAKIDEQHAHFRKVHEIRSAALQNKIADLQAQIARLDERTK